MHSSTLRFAAAGACALLLACGPKPATTSSSTPADTNATDASSSAAVDPIPAAFGPLTPQIVVTDVAGAADFYGKAFGGTTTLTLPAPDGNGLMHAEVQIGDSLIMIDPAMGESKDPKALGGTPVTLMLYVEDADATFESAVAAGGTPVMPMADQFWGDRYGMIIDPAGHMWAIASHVEDLTGEQMGERSKLAFAPPKKDGTAAWAHIKGTPAAKRVPDDYHTITMSLTVTGAAEAIDFYTKYLGATERSRMPHPDGRLMHAEIEIGGDVLMLADEFPEMGGKSASTLGGSPVAIHHYIPDVDAAFSTMIDAGASELFAPQDMFWGDRFASVADPKGFVWGLATHREDLTQEQIAERLAADMQAEGGGGAEAAQ